MTGMGLDIVIRSVPQLMAIFFYPNHHEPAVIDEYLRESVLTDKGMVIGHEYSECGHYKQTVHRSGTLA